LIFVDSNVLIYDAFAESPSHAAAKATLEQWRSSGTLMWVSSQVLRECLAAFTRPQPFGAALAPLLATTRIRGLQRSFLVARDHPVVTLQLLDLIDSIPIGGAQVHDANIVATMLAHGIPRLLTGNVDDFARFDHLIELVPLA